MTEVNCSFIGVHVELKICNYLICSLEKKRERKKEREKERGKEREREKKRNQTKYAPSLSTSLLASTMSVFVLGNYAHGPSEFFLLMTPLY